MAKRPEKDPVLVTFGLRVSGERKARGWSQAFLAERVGVDRTHIGRIERAEQNVGLLSINQLALVLGEAAVGFIPCPIEHQPERRIRK